MVQYTEGNLLEAETEALVNTVNEVGVMGKGIALMFREAFPENMAEYEQACRKKEVRVGKMFVTENRSLVGPKWIINFPTKRHWRQPSRLEWVREGLKDLVRVIRERDIHSVALPPLGCGNGGLDWKVVRAEIESAMESLDDVNVLVFEPTARYQNVPKRQGLEELTPARALIAELVRRYCVLGIECSNLEIQKLAWFLQRVILAKGLSDPLKLDFVANRYGPYADKLRHLLNGLDGSYLHCEKRLSDASPFDTIYFDDAKAPEVSAYLEQSDAAAKYLPALYETAAIIDGFESPLGMELLSTVDWLLEKKDCAHDTESVRIGLSEWPGDEDARQRKLKLFDDRLIGLALQRLTVEPSILTR